MQDENQEDLGWEEHQVLQSFNPDSLTESGEDVIWEGTVTTIQVEDVSDNEEVNLDSSLDIEKEDGERVKKSQRKKYTRSSTIQQKNGDTDGNVQEVLARFKIGCECNDDSCFRGLNAESVYKSGFTHDEASRSGSCSMFFLQGSTSTRTRRITTGCASYPSTKRSLSGQPDVSDPVLDPFSKATVDEEPGYLGAGSASRCDPSSSSASVTLKENHRAASTSRCLIMGESRSKHRLNIAELTKEEHDMYLMGVTMACMSDPGVTVKRKERQRFRAHYVYQGRKVCLSAFLYLENCTLYQLKRIRKHVMTHGVTPRVHGNHGKKPHNVFSLDIYRRATNFLKDFIKQHAQPSGVDSMKSTVILPADISRKTIHKAYEEYVKSIGPGDEKIMGYSTFRHFMKEQFPYVRFCKSEQGTSSVTSHSIPSSSRFTGKTTSRGIIEDKLAPNVDIFSLVTLPVVISDKPRSVTETPAYVYSPVQQVVHSQQDSFQPKSLP